MADDSFVYAHVRLYEVLSVLTSGTPSLQGPFCRRLNEKDDIKLLIIPYRYYSTF